MPIARTVAFPGVGSLLDGPEKCTLAPLLLVMFDKAKEARDSQDRVKERFG